MSFSIGIVGLPNAGKSTLFKALTKKQVEIANYPFTTIHPNIGVIGVPDERLKKLAEILKPEKLIPTHIEFVDIAGLVKNAHEGEGLGNQFLAQIRETDAILHLVRVFRDENVSHPDGEINPTRDVETINLELIFADLFLVEKALEKIQKRVKGQDKEALQKLPVLEKLKQSLNQGKMVNAIELSEEEKTIISDLSLLTIKPILYVFNIDEKELNNKNNSIEIKICAKIEAELADLSEDEVKDYIKEMGLKTTGLDQLILASYKLLDLITFFTCQNHILQAWTIKKGSKTPEAAAKIHTDFAKGFIKAEVINWQDLIKAGSEHLARELGLLKTEGRDYVIQEGDVIHFRFA